MSKYSAVVKYEIDSDNASLEAITAYFDNQGNENVSIDIEDDEADDGSAEMVIISADARVEITEY
jgi:hypothetical protein